MGMAMIDQYSKRRSRKILKPAGAERDPTPVGAQSTPKPGANPGANGFHFGDPMGEVNSAAVDVWDQLLKNTDYIRLAGNTEFFHQRVFKALSDDAPLILSEVLKRDMMNRKEEFIRTKEIDLAKLSLSLQEQFTQIVIKQVVVELKKCKEAIMCRINYLDDLGNQVIRRQAVLHERMENKSKIFTDLENSINEMASIVSEHLKNIREDNPEIGTIPYTLAVLEEFLNQNEICDCFVLIFHSFM